MPLHWTPRLEEDQYQISALAKPSPCRRPNEKATAQGQEAVKLRSPHAQGSEPGTRPAN